MFNNLQTMLNTLQMDFTITTHKLLNFMIFNTILPQENNYGIATTTQIITILMEQSVDSH